MDYEKLHKLLESNDSKSKLNVIYNKEEFSKIHIFDKIKLIKSLNDESKYSLLHDENFIEILYKEHKFSEYNINVIFETLGDEYTYKLLCDCEYVENILKLEKYQIADGIKRIQNVKEKIELLESYKEFISIYIAKIVETFDDETKIDFLLNEKGKNNGRFDIIEVLASMGNIGNLMRFFKENKDFLIKNHIKLYDVVKSLDSDEKIEEVIVRLKEANLTSKEEKEVIVMMPEKIKEKKDIFPENYKYLLDIHLIVQNYEKVIIPDLTKDIEIYRDLDNLIMIDPENYSEEEKRGKLMQLCSICPNLRVLCSSFGIISLSASGEDYIQAETWIISVLDKLEKENYTDLQKLAIIDNEIGKRVSYSPDYGTEMFESNESRKIWKILSSGYGVCNGIADTERYILKRAGINSKRVGSKNHSFLLLENLKVQNPDGSIRTMNTIIDPTWNLSSHRFGSLPTNFCVSYKEIREHDIGANGIDRECHKNDEELITATSSLDREELREIFKSVGLTREDGKFPVYDWIVESDKIAEKSASNLEQYLTEQFLLFEKMYPQFNDCPNESMKVIKDIILKNEKIKFNTAVIDRVYEKEDISKKTFFYIYVQADEFREKFYIADKEKGKILELSRAEFSKRFECYDMDLSKNKGIRPWDEDKEKQAKLTENHEKTQAVKGEEAEGR